MYQSLKLVSISISLLLITGCSQKLPMVSHAHIGHALTAWRDTPDEQGLFVVAEKNTRTALSETIAAIESGQNQTKVQYHLENTLFALNPDLAEVEKDSGYGAIRALNGTTDHMVFAAESDDASHNLKSMVYEFSEAQTAVLDRMNLAVEVTRLAQKSSGREQHDLLLQLKSTIYSVLEGDDLDRDGKIGPENEEYGLLQLRVIISKGLKNEKPAYQPVEKKYLFGLIRLPSGFWVYRFNRSGAKKTKSNRGSSVDRSYDYSYDNY